MKGNLIKVAAVAITLCSVQPVGAEPFGSLSMTIRILPPSLGLPFTANGAPSSFYWHALFDTLTEWDVDGNLVPALALSWELRDPLTWVFELRPDVRFSNGDIHDAEAVAATLNWLVQTTRGKGTFWGREINTVARAEAETGSTVAVTTVRPDPLIPQKFSGVHIAHPSAFVSDDAVDAFAQNPIGTGPFVLDAWRNERGRSRLLASPGAWRQPGFGEFLLIPAPDSMSRLQAVTTGLADVTAAVPPEVLPEAEAARLTVHKLPMTAVTTFMFRTVGNAGSPVNDARVCRAFNYAVNKELMAVLAGGEVSLSGQGAPTYVFGYNPDIEPYPYDPDKARVLLAEAGYGDGLNLTMTTTATDSTVALLAQRIAQDLAAVGVNVEVQSTTGQLWLQMYTMASFETDMFNLSWASAPVNDASRPLEYTSCLRVRPFFCDESVVPLLQRAQVELDANKRLALLQQAQAVVHDLAPAIFLHESVIYAASGPRIKSLPWRLTVPAYDLVELAGS